MSVGLEQPRRAPRKPDQCLSIAMPMFEPMYSHSIIDPEARRDRKSALGRRRAAFTRTLQ